MDKERKTSSEEYVYSINQRMILSIKRASFSLETLCVKDMRIIDMENMFPHLQIGEW